MMPFIQLRKKIRLAASKNKKLLTALLSVFCMVFLFGCHGAKTSSSFEMPEAFDETKPVEITFWAKNDTNKNQTDVYKKAIATLKRCIQTSM